MEAKFKCGYMIEHSHQSFFGADFGACFDAFVVLGTDLGADLGAALGADLGAVVLAAGFDPVFAAGFDVARVMNGCWTKPCFMPGPFMRPQPWPW